MTGSGLHATALIGLGTLIKTEKCLPPAPQDEETQAECRVGVVGEAEEESFEDMVRGVVGVQC